MSSRKYLLLATAAGVSLTVLPPLVANPYLLHLLILALLWVSLGQSWNLLGGYTGQVSFGHAAFFGMGAYTAALLKTRLGLSPWLGFPLSGITAVILAVFIGWVCFRLRGPYFALSVLALAEVLRLVATNWRPLTNGAQGILIIPGLTGKLPYYYLALGLALVTTLTVAILMRTKWGFYFIAIREDQDAAESMGIDVTRYKLYSLLVSAFFTGLAGSFYLNYMGFIDPHIVFSISQVSIMMILVVILGGVATIWGPVIGAFAYIFLSEVFRDWVGKAHLTLFGILLILTVIFLPNGIVGEAAKLRRLARLVIRPGRRATA